jgi:hypothetical protein
MSSSPSSTRQRRERVRQPPPVRPHHPPQDLPEPGTGRPGRPRRPRARPPARPAPPETEVRSCSPPLPWQRGRRCTGGWKEAPSRSPSPGTCSNAAPPRPFAWPSSMPSPRPATRSAPTTSRPPQPLALRPSKRPAHLRVPTREPRRRAPAQRSARRRRGWAHRAAGLRSLGRQRHQGDYGRSARTSGAGEPTHCSCGPPRWAADPPSRPDLRRLNGGPDVTAEPRQFAGTACAGDDRGRSSCPRLPRTTGRTPVAPTGLVAVATTSTERSGTAAAAATAGGTHAGSVR